MPSAPQMANERSRSVDRRPGAQRGCRTRQPHGPVMRARTGATHLCKVGLRVPFWAVHDLGAL